MKLSCFLLFIVRMPNCFGRNIYVNLSINQKYEIFAYDLYYLKLFDITPINL